MLTSIEDLLNRFEGVDDFIVDFLNHHHISREEMCSLVAFLVSDEQNTQLEPAVWSETVEKLGKEIRRNLKEIISTAREDVSILETSSENFKKAHGLLQDETEMFERRLNSWMDDQYSSSFDGDMTYRNSMQESIETFKNARQNWDQAVAELISERKAKLIANAEMLYADLHQYLESFFIECWPELTKSCKPLIAYEEQLLDYFLNEIDFDVEHFYNFDSESLTLKLSSPKISSKCATKLHSLGYGFQDLFDGPVTKSYLVKLRALYDNESTEESELSFKAGEELTLLQKSDDNWWWAENGQGDKGHIPSNYVEEMPIESAPELTGSEPDSSTRSDYVDAPESDEHQDASDNSDAPDAPIQKAQLMKDGSASLTNTPDINQRITSLRQSRRIPAAAETSLSPTGEEQEADAKKRKSGNGVFKKFFHFKKEKKNRSAAEERVLEAEESADESGSVTGEFLSQLDSRTVLENYHLDQFIDGVPELISDSVAYLLERGTKEEGIFRIPGKHSRIRELAAAYASGSPPNLMEEYDPMTIAGLLKFYCMEANWTIVPPKFMQVLSDSRNTPSEEERVKSIADALINRSVVPERNYNVLQLLFFLFNEIVKNVHHTKLTAKNFSRVFALSLFQDKMTVGAANIIMDHMLENYHEIFQNKRN